MGRSFPMESENRRNPAFSNDTLVLPEGDGAVVSLSGEASAAVRLAGVAGGVQLQREAGRWRLHAGADSGAQRNGQAVLEGFLADRDFISIHSYQFHYAQDRLLIVYCPEDGVQTTLAVAPPDEQAAGMAYPQFLRSTRLKRRLWAQTVEIQPPKPPQKAREESLIALIMPPLIMAALTLVMRSAMGSFQFALYASVMMGSSIVVSVFSYRRQRKQSAEDEAKRQQGYRAYLDKKRAQIAALRKVEGETRRVIHRPLQDSFEALRHFTSDLFDRAPGDEDFLNVTLGMGQLRSMIQVKTTLREYAEAEDPLSEDIAVLERDTLLQDVPVTLSLLEAGAVGVCGGRDALYEVAKCAALDIALRHIDSEVRMYFILRDEAEAQAYEWSKWLPHVAQREAPLRNIVYDEESRAFHLERLYTLLTDREARLQEGDQETRWDEYIVVLVLDCDGVRDHPISRFFAKCGALGCAFLFFDERQPRIPKGCAYLIKHHSEQNGAFLIDCENDAIDALTQDHGVWFAYRRVPDETTHAIAARLAPIYVVQPSLEGQMTRMITLFETLGIQDAAQWDVGRRWKESRIQKSMAVPLGVMAGNQPLLLDLHEKGHGPHGLVAGTTGSGKSELLLSIVISLSAHFSTEDIGFLIIDFKGEGLVGQLRALPHLLGAITNLDGNEVTRSLRFIRAEILRRQQLLKAAGEGVKDAAAYAALRRERPGLGLPPLPHLVIIVDEFAELAAEHHDFLQELNSASRIGRSLGLHLILATQKPAGIITPQIDSNSRFRLCLMVQTKEDSTDVIKTPIAAEIRERGRAYLRVGTNEVFELFQSAYSGAPLDTDREQPFFVYELNHWGKRRLIHTNVPQEDSVDAPVGAVQGVSPTPPAQLRAAPGWDDLDADPLEEEAGEEAPREAQEDGLKWQYQALIRRIRAHCQASGILPQPKICLPPLPSRLYWQTLDAPRPDPLRIRVAVGLADDPDAQWQGAFPIDFSEAHLYIVGAAQMGKTALLKTMLFALARRYTPAQVSVYILDMGKGMPRSFEQSGIVGGIVYPEEDVRMQNLLHMIEREIESRKTLYEQHGVGSHKAFLESGGSGLPYILLMVDGYVALKEQHEPIAQGLLSLSHDAVSAGVYLIVTSTRALELSMRAMTYFGQRIALRCNGADEYSVLFDRCRMEPKETPGRGLIARGKRILEFQTALPTQGRTERARNERMLEAFGAQNALYGDARARPIPMVPASLPLREFRKAYRQVWPGEAYTLPIGLSYSTVQPYAIDLLEWELLALVGRAHSGRTNFVRLLLANLREKSLQGIPLEAYILDDPRRSLREDEGFAREYDTQAERIVEFMELAVQTLQARAEAMEGMTSAADRARWLAQQPLLLLIALHPGAAAELSKDEAAKKLLKAFLAGSAYKASLVLLLDNISGFTLPDVYKAVQERKRALYFDAVKGGGVKLFSGIPASVANRFARPTLPGDAYPIIDEGILCKVRTILMDQE